MECGGCGTAVEGHFPPLPYAALTPEQLDFLEIFLRARGNLREVERILGLSYPTVRSRLDAVLGALGFAPQDEAEAGDGGEGDRVGGTGAPPGPRAAEVLAALERGEITVAEAVARLRGER
jgi:hypothetical protein